MYYILSCNKDGPRKPEELNRRSFPLKMKKHGLEILLTYSILQVIACLQRETVSRPQKKLWSDHDNTCAEVSSCVGTFTCRGHDCYQIKLLISNGQKQI